MFRMRWLGHCVMNLWVKGTNVRKVINRRPNERPKL